MNILLTRVEQQSLLWQCIQ